MQKIKLTKGKNTIVDEKYYAEMSKFNWCISYSGYALRNIKEEGKWKQVFMHRIINQTPIGKFTDHINGDKLDNRRDNLRLCDKAQNAHNSRVYKNNSSGVKGVYWHKAIKRWITRITLNRKSKYLGSFVSLSEASQVYDNAAIKHYGEFALLNNK